MITASFTYKDGEEEITLTDEYSVAQYLSSIREGEYSGSAKILGNAAWAYGHFLQPYLARIKGWTAGEAYEALPYSGTVNVSAAGSGSGAHRYTLRTMDRDIVAAARYKLALDADTALTLEVELKDTPADPVTMTVNGNSAVPAVDGKTYRVAVGGIAANNLGVAYPVTMKIGESVVFDITVSPLSYVNAVLPLSAKEDEQNALAALYEYWQAASSYAGQN